MRAVASVTTAVGAVEAALIVVKRNAFGSVNERRVFNSNHSWLIRSVHRLLMFVSLGDCSSVSIPSTHVCTRVPSMCVNVNGNIVRRLMAAKRRGRRIDCCYLNRNGADPFNSYCFPLFSKINLLIYGARRKIAELFWYSKSNKALDIFANV